MSKELFFDGLEMCGNQDSIVRSYRGEVGQILLEALDDTGITLDDKLRMAEALNNADDLNGIEDVLRVLNTIQWR